MKDTLEKLRALVSMKSTLCDAIRDDLKKEQAKNNELQYAFQVICRQNLKLVNEVNELKQAEAMLLRDNQDLVKQLEQDQWWKAQDDELSRQEAGERADEVEIPLRNIMFEEQQIQAAEAMAIDDEEEK